MRQDILQKAIRDRIEGYAREIVLHAAIGGCSVVLGIGLFVFLWLNLRTDGSEIVKEAITSAVSLITFGAGGAILTRLMALREEIAQGQIWLEAHQVALGPPPDKLLGKIQEKILAWLEG